ncbi:MAG: hypothetical protein ACRDN0_40025 [Trebonia sp.]
MGKASKRKSQRRQGTGLSRADFEKQRAYEALPPGIQAMAARFEAKNELENQARKAWCGGAEPHSATFPRWREDSAGDRFFSARDIITAARAPVLTDAELPTARQVAENSGHWAVAVSALVRAVVLDRVPVSDPVVARVLELLTPVVLDELAADDEDRDLPDIDGPLFLLGGCYLTEATWAIIGLDPLDQILPLLEQRIDGAGMRAGGAALPGGKAVAEELVRAFADEYRCEDPGDIQTLERLGRTDSGNPLTDLIRAREVAPEDALRLGLIVLAALADLARTDADSVLSGSDVVPRGDHG